ncbi:MAG: ATP-dependent Clp protease ATP-binding subunit [Planctomycetes bacterium]|nr:ATP-dependent Clp protease ATP-binding subunit [Planctomycetota bacterium]
MDVLSLLSGLTVGAIAGAAGLAWWRARPSEDPDSPAGDEPEPAALDGATPDPLYALADELQSFFDASAHPSDLLRNERFSAGVTLLAQPSYAERDLAGYFLGDSALICCLALEALAVRDDDPGEALDTVEQRIGEISPWARFFAFRYLHARAREPLLARMLAQLDVDQWGYRMSGELLKEFITQRLTVEQQHRFAPEAPAPSEETRAFVLGLLDQLGAPARDLASGYRAALEGRIDKELLRKIGRVWTDEPSDEPILQDEGFVEQVATVCDALTKPGHRSVLLVGEDGVGKATLLKAVAANLCAEGWVIFEAGSRDLLSGQSYMGELEERINELMACLSNKPKLLWSIPDLPEMLLAGRHRYGTTSVLDHFLPLIETGRVQVIARVRRDAQERLFLSLPKLRGAVDSMVIEAATPGETLEMAQRWAAHHGAPGIPLLDQTTLAEAMHLAAQYLGERAAPGSLLDFLKLTRQWRQKNAPGPDDRISRDDLLFSLSRLTGLPLSMLDDGAGLDVSLLRQHFEKHVLGQPEAVECLVERVAMIKAGLTDPTRPSGVFLFAGPTGTGKTEIARTLADFLFGSPERMIRLDMSEFQDHASLDRILGDTDEQSRKQALVHLIRKQPFSVVLLDEFEKAHHSVWDLFLQVFDDGRLTDRLGQRADFRHAIVILTSNAGSRDLRGSGLGFGAAGSSELPRELTSLFRPELLNRLDRVVMFRPLSKAVMRQILAKELTQVLDRRGLRHRQWAVEWDESALAFLLDRGFTTDMGARPLKRAIERYLLSPLAMTIVHRQAPAGDQFLFVRSDGQRIEVEFVDPDAHAEGPGYETPAAGSDLRLGPIALDGTGRPEEVRVLGRVLDELRSAVDDPQWRAAKAAALEAMSEPDFWNTPERFATLCRAENMDRLETGVETAARLHTRLGGDGRPSYSADLVRRLAEQLHVLAAAHGALRAGRSWEALLRVDIDSTAGDDPAPTRAFAQRLTAMYRAWAKQRRMAATVLQEGDGIGPALVLAVSGFAALDILLPEAGMHQFELTRGRETVRLRVRVTVAADTTDEREGLARRRERAMALLDAAAPPRDRVVRRYRDEPSPLVRDGVRGWRSGRPERVYEGNFDLL